jgi:two-component sensor histidine kinase
LQSRASTNSEAAEQLAAAAHRVSMIVRVHKRLHSYDGLECVAFKQYVEDICHDFSEMLSVGDELRPVIVDKAIKMDLPAHTGVALGFIVKELLANAVKHGKGQVIVSLEPHPATGYALSVSSDGPHLPEGFDPASCKGLGMKIILTFVQRIGGQFQFGLGGNGQGTRFTVLFS